jgi:hypothetical protein
VTLRSGPLKAVTFFSEGSTFSIRSSASLLAAACSAVTSPSRATICSQSRACPFCFSFIFRG